MPNQVVPFLLNERNVRGRAIRLDSAVSEILSRHDYPPRVSQLLAEAISIVAMLSTNLKSDGVLTLQLQSKGPITMLVADGVHGGGLRGYADVDEEALKQLPENASLEQLFSEGYLAMTLDAGEGMERYQGVVALEGNSIAQVIENYYRQSQQTDMSLTLAVGKMQGGQQVDEGWIAGGMMIERMPLEGAQEDAWDEALALAKTLRDDELLDSELLLSDLLHRLYHEGGVWVYEPHDMHMHCRCSKEKMVSALMTLSEEDREASAKNGVIEMHCHFCNKTQDIPLEFLR